MKIFLTNENMSFIVQKYFSQWKYVIYRMKIFLTNENISFIEEKYFSE